MEVSTLLKQMRCCTGNVYRDATDITKVTLQVYEKLIIKASTPKWRGQYIHHSTMTSEAHQEHNM